MDELKKLLGTLLKRGWATSAEKSKVQSLFKELGADEQEEVKDDVESTEALPDTDPATGGESEDNKDEDEVAKSILNSLGKRIDDKISAGFKQIDEAVKKMQKTMTGSMSRNRIAIDPEQYKQFASDVLVGKKADLVVELKDFDLRAKVAGDMSETGNITGELPQAELDTMVSRAPQREPFIEDLVTVGTISSNLDAWIETASEDGTILPVAELAEIPQKDYDFVRRTAEVKKIGVHSKYSREMAEDLPNLIGEIKNFLIADLRRAVDAQLLSGDGTGENLTGILENATAYASGDFTGTIAEANRFDVIETAVAQVLTALHTPNYLILHPTDRAKLRLTKGTDGHYVLPPFIMSDGSVISGVRVVVNTGITAGNFLVGDFTKSSVKYKRGLTVELTNTDQDDFVKDRFTVKATVRLVHRVRQNDYEAFVYGNFDTAIVALDTTS